MIYIAHRGNLTGPNKEQENHPDYIMEAINSGYHCEIDFWKENDKLLLGHDEPQYEIDFSFLFTPNLIIHCKNLHALTYLADYQNECVDLHFFFHDTDDATLTSLGYIWVYPGRPILSNGSIVVMPERIMEEYDFKKAGGICSDYISEYKKSLKFRPNNAI